jgi:phospholipase/carboxylesterase
MNLSLNYLIREPKIKLDKTHFYFYFTDMVAMLKISFANELPDEYYVIAASTYDLQYGSYAWYAINFDADQNKFSDNEQAKSSRDLIAGFIDELILKDTDNFLTGRLKK